METASTVAARRKELLQRLMPAGLPRLWCPLLTHYRGDGTIDLDRTARHLDSIRPFVGGLLLAGSTGDGWELGDAERLRLIADVLPLARARGFVVQIGVLKPNAAQMREGIDSTLDVLRSAACAGDWADPIDLCAACGVIGVTLCPPSGAALPQAAIATDLDALLATGVPISLYQLPQVTRNEIDPATVAGLMRRHPNLIMVKDTSGTDRIADAGITGVVLLRGSEGSYALHPASAGGRYDGLLLSTANGLAAPLAGILDALIAGRGEQARTISQRVEAVADVVFAAAATLPHGNAFTNANKAIDHVMAYGAMADRSAGPQLHAGTRLPVALIETAIDALARHELLPARGYLETESVL
jgi:dihydrodipicolinate synthase/N-acetylneuraminate lyase